MIYEFECPDCKLTFEKEYSLQDYCIPSCPSCMSPFTKRKYSSLGIDFSKGGAGFYKNDYKEK